MKPKYEMEIVNKKETKPNKLKEQEEALKDLTSTLPLLRKHNIHGQVEDQVRVLRNGRKTKTFTLRLSRKYNGQVISVEAPVEKETNKLAVVRALKTQIIDKIKQIRKEERETTIEKVYDEDGKVVSQNKVPIVEKYSFRQGLVVPKQDMTYLEPGTFLKALMKKIREDMTQGSKSPKDKDLYVGIEIELAAKESRDTLCDRLFDAGLGKYVTVKDDGSIGDGERQEGIKSTLRQTHKYTHEICVLVKQSEVADIVTKLCDVLNTKLKVAVDRTCGLHVHLDMRNRKVDKCFSNLVLSQQFLYAMLPAQRRNSQYSIPVKGAQYRKLSSRYYGINQTAVDKYGTLELRMHCGTTNAKKIISWVQLLVAIVDAPAMTSAATKADDFATQIGIGNDLLTYVKARMAKFADQHKKNVPSKEEPGTMPNVEYDTKEVPKDDTSSEDSEVA